MHSTSRRSSGSGSGSGRRGSSSSSSSCSSSGSSSSSSSGKDTINLTSVPDSRDKTTTQHEDGVDWSHDHHGGPRAGLHEACDATVQYSRRLDGIDLMNDGLPVAYDPLGRRVLMQSSDNASFYEWQPVLIAWQRSLKKAHNLDYLIKFVTREKDLFSSNKHYISDTEGKVEFLTKSQSWNSGGHSIGRVGSLDPVDPFIGYIPCITGDSVNFSESLVIYQLDDANTKKAGNYITNKGRGVTTLEIMVDGLVELLKDTNIRPSQRLLLERFYAFINHRETNYKS